jgi:hypothetical protein
LQIRKNRRIFDMNQEIYDEQNIAI